MERNNLKLKIKKNLGLSILELLIYVSILSGLVMISTNMFISLSRGSGQSQAKNEVDTAMRFVTDLLKQDIKNAASISIPTSGNSSSTLTLLRNSKTIVYDVSDGMIRRKEDAGSPVNIFSPNVSVGSTTFTRIENTNLIFNLTTTSIQIKIDFSYRSSNPDWTYDSKLQTTIDLGTDGTLTHTVSFIVKNNKYL